MITNALALPPLPPPLTLTTMFTEWTFDAPVVVVALLLGGAYFAATKIARTRGTPWQQGRSVAFGTGIALILFMSVSFFGRYADTLFWARAAQVIVLLMVAPLCLALGSPIALALAVLSTSGVNRLQRLLASRIARVLTFPATASILLIATPWMLYFTGWYSAMLRHDAIDELTKLALLSAGFLYFYSRLQLDPVPRRYPHLISVVITFVEVIFDAALGLVLWLGPNLIANDYYQALHRVWGPSQRTDQIIGAGVLWIVGDLAGLPFLSALMNRMKSDDAQEAAEIDRLLDENELAASTEKGASALWWENDPVLAERFRREQP